MNVSLFKQNREASGSFADASVLPGATTVSYFSAPNRLYSHHHRLIGRFRCPSDDLSTCDWLLHMSVRNNQILLAESHGRERSAVAHARTGNKWI